MTADVRQERIDELFLEALERDPSQRRAWLDQACFDDASLRAEVEKLLQADANAEVDGFLSASIHLAPTIKPRQAPQSDAPHPETIGRYRVVGVLGEGGQAAVYRAVHPTLPKEVVVKLSFRPLGGAQPGRDLLVQEGKLLAELDHPNLARVYDLDFHEGRPFLVMEYVPGRNLEQYAKGRRLSPRQIATLMAKIARALVIAHTRGVVHRDLKPANIIIDEYEQPRVIDFGIARMQHAWSVDRPEHGVSGTPQYMATEQARGDAEHIDERTDIFALGATLYFLLTGQAPYPGEEPLDVLYRASSCDFDRALLRKSKIPRRLQQICLRAMQADPAARYPTAEPLADDLEQFARPVPWLAGAAIAGTAALVLGVAAWYAILSGPANTPSLQRVELYVRHKSDDKNIEGHTLVADGAERPGAPIGPLRPDDDFRIIAECSQPAYWYLVWFDTAGSVEVTGPLGRQARKMEYPSQDSFMSVNAADPEGVHLLVVVAGSRAMDSEVLKRRLRGVEWPSEHVQLASADVRGAGTIRKSNAKLGRSFLEELEGNLPRELKPLHLLQLPTAN